MGTISRLWLTLLFQKGKQEKKEKRIQETLGVAEGVLAILGPELPEIAKNLSNLENSEVFKLFALPCFKNIIGFPQPSPIPTKVLVLLFICLHYSFS